MFYATGHGDYYCREDAGQENAPWRYAKRAGGDASSYDSIVAATASYAMRLAPKRRRSRRQRRGMHKTFAHAPVVITGRPWWSRAEGCPSSYN